MTDFNKCSICLEDYDLEARCPYIISPCGHNYCQTCLSKQGNCAFCRVKIEKPIKNHALASMIESKIEADKWKLKCSLHNRKIENFCKQCKTPMCVKCNCKHQEKPEEIISKDELKAEVDKLTERVMELNKNKEQAIEKAARDEDEIFEEAETFLENYTCAMKIRLEQQKNKLQAHKIKIDNIEIPKNNTIENCISIYNKIDNSFLTNYKEKIEKTYKDQMDFLASLSRREVIIGFQEWSENPEMEYSTAVKIDEMPDYLTAVNKRLKAKLGPFIYDEDELGDENLVKRGPYVVMENLIYEGQWKDGMRHGRGKQSWKSGAFYEGYWRDDKKNGKGMIIYAGGSAYQGQWKDNHIQGKGELISANGDRYVGDFKNSLKDGKGVFYYKNGDMFEGIWVNNKREGSGKMTYANGTVENLVYKDDNAFPSLFRSAARSQIATPQAVGAPVGNTGAQGNFGLAGSLRLVQGSQSLFRQQP